ncbi:Disease resistance protein [Nymphaea thermarum]|nr:Disease resistance protein [Nymphaea thermarum]
MAIVIEALAEKAISILLEAVTSLLTEEVDLILNAKDELKKLQRKLKRLEVALKDADRKPFFSSERDRYLEGELKDVFYDAQDIIEKYQTKIKLSKREKDSLTSWNKVRKPWITLCSCFKLHVCASYKFSNETKKINGRLDEIKKDWDIVVLLKTIQKVGDAALVSGEYDNPRETTHHIGVESHMGREDDKKVIVKKLLSHDSTHSSMTKKGSVSIISIIGKGGIGKTTLAKMVFREIQQQFGKRRWWVCISERPNRKDLLQKILKEVKEVRKDPQEDTNSSLSELCTQLRNELSKDKYLLVLDDVWDLNWWDEEVGETLMAGAMGSKILITSRNRDVSHGMHASYMHELRELNFQQIWDLFLKGALSEGQTEQDLVIHNVRDVGESIVKKCGGLPLVIKTVGSMMHTKRMSRENWKSVEDSKIWEWKRSAASSSTSEIGGDILPGLMLSYDDLPYYLKSCFVYCCIHPKDYEIERERLIMQWVAHGLIEEKENIDVEATADQYIEDLIRRCLIEENNESYCGRRDIEDFIAWKLSKEVGKLCNLRYLGLEGTMLLTFVAEGLGKLTNLRTLHGFMVCNDKEKRRGNNIRELKDLKKLKGALSIKGLGSRKAIDDVGNAQLLKEKDGIISLEFDFGITKDDDEQRGDDKQSGVLEALEPPLGLECLKIRHYKGQMPAWHLNTEYTKLHSLTLERCHLWEKLICITSLKVLHVDKCPGLREIASMPALESLEVSWCSSLERLPHHMPALKSLDVALCDSLEQLPHHMPAVKSLTVYGCNWEGWPTGRSGETTFTSVPCLREADFKNCPNMQTEGLISALSELAGHKGRATQLQRLSVENCPSARLGWKLLEQLSNLIELKLDSKSAVLLPSSLPSQVSTFLPSLKHLHLRDNMHVDEEVQLGKGA